MRRYLLAGFALSLVLAGCANEYSNVPEPQGDWVDANPPALAAPPADTIVPQQPRRWRQVRR